jgi:hypothetical protein
MVRTERRKENIHHHAQNAHFARWFFYLSILARFIFPHTQIVFFLASHFLLNSCTSHIITVANLFTVAFPDRLSSLFALTTATVTTLMNVISPALPKSIIRKVNYVKSTQALKTKLINEILAGGEADLPTFLGGTCVHDERIIKNYSLMMVHVKVAMDAQQERMRMEAAAAYAEENSNGYEIRMRRRKLIVT